MWPGIERLACSSFVIRREACVKRSHHSHNTRIKYSPNRIWIRITSVEESKYETSSRTCSNQTNCNIAP